MGIRSKIKNGFKKFGRALGGPITAIVDGAKAVKDGKGAKGAIKAFGKAAAPGASLKEIHDANVDLTSALAEATGGEKAAGRVDDIGRIIKPALPDFDGPVKTIETIGSAGKAVVKGDFRRAGRSLARAGIQPGLDIVSKVAEAGQATGDLFDSATQRLDERALPILKRIFGKGLDYDAIRVKEGRPGPGKSSSATTFPSLIYLGVGNKQLMFDASLNPLTKVLIPEGTVAQVSSLFVHELVHSWQNQHGGSAYLAEAVFGYTLHGEKPSYHWWNFTDYNMAFRIDDRRGIGKMGNTWRDMPVEAQAEFIQNAYVAGAFDGDRNALNYLHFTLQSNGLNGDERTSYANAFGTTTVIDWSSFLKGAVKTLHKGDFRF